MPEFIVKWNSNKRKRFRPVTPSTSRSPKKRRTGVTEFKPRFYTSLLYSDSQNCLNVEIVPLH
ncbi:hypothetical protein MFLAVUS_007627 [Mucor flavus]|uniref:Uncharacterized protein n=1 Tax=Mucor flavus TaxID=439312 RepID=A0ABP9Z4U6_9FUNG